MTQPASATAYKQDQARSYDQHRFTSAAGKRVHEAEWILVEAVLRRQAPGAQCLEVGCGTGRLMMEVLRAGYRVDGVDASPEMLQELQAKLEGAGFCPELKVAEAARLPYPPGCFDLVYSVRVLNQTESPEYALRAVGEIVRVVRPGGLALIEFVNAWRPRWAGNRGAATRLKPRAVLAAAQASGADLVEWGGAFFLSMQAFHRVPGPLLGLLARADRLLSSLLPRLCARTYLLVRKRNEA